jgi:putative acetyltransferase
VIIRSEVSSDYPAIRRVHIEAFANHPYSHQTEHLIVDTLRDASALTISQVAEIDGAIVAHIAFSPITMNGEDVRWFIVGPVGVLPSLQRRGIGSALVNRGLQLLRASGAHGCMLVGPPEYYKRFGFRHEPALLVEGVPPEVVLCLPFSGSVPAGKVEHHEAFFVTAS